jgi:hypothetical protein
MGEQSPDQLLEWSPKQLPEQLPERLLEPLGEPMPEPIGESPAPAPTPTPISNIPPKSANADGGNPLDGTPAMLLAQELRDAILTRDPTTKVPSDLRRWAIEADRMVRLDERDPSEASSLIEWCQCDPFWSSNILSMSAFRKQYDKLKRQSQNKRNNGRSYAGVHTTDANRMKAYEGVVQRA